MPSLVTQITFFSVFNRDFEDSNPPNLIIVTIELDSWKEKIN